MEKQKLQLSTRINAPKEKVWDVLLQDETYRQWTAPFCEGSYAVGDWQLGSKVHFLSPDGGGLVSKNWIMPSRISTAIFLRIRN